MGRVCEMCPEGAAKVATMFCPADACYLCTQCDEEVHSANRLAGRHVRRPVPTEEVADGSSINDDSEIALVPDVAEQPLPACDVSTELDDPESSNDMLFVELPNTAPVSFEDAPGYDFCDFEAGLEGRMPALCAIDDDAMFAEGKNMAKSLYGELSWESVIPENIEHVVPDISESATITRVATSGSLVKRDLIDMDIDVTPPNVVSTLSTSSGKDVKRVVEKSRVKTVVSRNGATFKSEKDVVVKREATVSSSSDGSRLVGRKRVREEDESGQEESTEIAGGDKSSDRETDEEKNIEQRKKRRMEALARFRSKRANRSFVKKVRYECRKQLADSRPRVKGRFVRKIEMALYRKYGALYREHLDELKQPKAEAKGDHCVPIL